MTTPLTYDRARLATKLSIGYRLGAGGRDPYAPTPADDYGQCDCSGFVAWCIGIPRRVTHPNYVRFNGGWLSTDGMVHDALTRGGILDDVGTLPYGEAAVGDVVVYGNGDRVGHCGIAAKVASVLGDVVVTSVIDCSSRGVRERSFETFVGRATTPVYVLRYTGWRP